MTDSQTKSRKAPIPLWLQLLHPLKAYAAAIYDDRQQRATAIAHTTARTLPEIPARQLIADVNHTIVELAGQQPDRCHLVVKTFPDVGGIIAVALTGASIAALATLVATILIDTPYVRNAAVQLTAVPAAALLGAAALYAVSRLARRQQADRIRRYLEPLALNPDSPNTGPAIRVERFSIGG